MHFLNEIAHADQYLDKRKLEVFGPMKALSKTNIELLNSIFWGMLIKTKKAKTKIENKTKPSLSLISEK